MKQHYYDRPNFHVVSSEAISGVVLNERNSRLNTQLISHNLLVRELNGDTQGQKADVMNLLCGNNDDTGLILQDAEDQLTTYLDIPSGIQTSELNDLKFPDNVSQLVRAGIDRQMLEGDQYGTMLPDHFDPNQIKAIMAIYGDKYIFDLLQSSGNGHQTPNSLIDTVNKLLGLTSNESRRPIQSATDDLLCRWVQRYDDRQVRQSLIDNLCSADETKLLLERHYVRPLNNFSVVKGESQRSRIWLHTANHFDLEEELLPDSSNSYPQTVGSVALKLVVDSMDTQDTA